MTPKEKAFDLIKKFSPCDIKHLSIDKLDWDYVVSEFRYDPLEHALICVDEIMDSSPMYYTGFEYESNLEYWQEVKQEIEKL